MNYSIEDLIVDVNLVKDTFVGVLKEIPLGIRWGWKKAIDPRNNTLQVRNSAVYGRGNKHPYVSVTEVFVSEGVRWGFWLGGAGLLGAGIYYLLS